MIGSHRTQLATFLSPAAGDEYERGELVDDGDVDVVDAGAVVVAGTGRRGRGRGGATDLGRIRRHGPGERAQSVASGVRLPAATSFPFSTHARGFTG